MLNIKDTIRHIENAKAIHFKFVKCRIRRRINNSKCGDSTCKICQASVQRANGIPRALRNYLLNDANIENLIAGKPDVLFRINNEIWESLIVGYSFTDLQGFLSIKNKKRRKMSIPERSLFDQYNKPYTIISKIIEYSGWFQNPNNSKRYDVYELAINLDRNTCTYCNRIYTSTVKDKNDQKVMRPQFDHWFPQKKYPLLALSFYNLIPSCSVCNSSIKSDSNFLLASHMHPYVDINSHDRVLFSYDHVTSLNSYRIKLKFNQGDSKAFQTLNDLKTKEIYISHISELKDLIKVKEAYSSNYIKFLIENFPKAKLSPNEVYQLVFGVEPETDNFHKKPLSKFKKDILTELGIIK